MFSGRVRNGKIDRIESRKLFPALFSWFMVKLLN